MLMALSPILVLVAVLIYGAVHSLLASLWAKRGARRWFGTLADRSYRLIYNLFAVVSFLPVLALVAALPDRQIYTIPFPWAILAVSGQIIAIIALLVGLLQTGVWTFLGLRQLVGSVDGDKPALVARGLYRWVRHPLYTAGLLFIWLSPLMTLNLLALNIGLTAYILIGATFEERRLQREFGMAYADYQKSTPMLVPGLKSRKLASTARKS